MPEKLDHDSTQKLLALVKEQHDREIDRVNSQMDNRFGEISEQIGRTGDDLKEAMASNTQERKNQIETVEGKINKKLDAVDEALRGNGKIGIYEQLRSIKTQLKIIYILLILLFGFKLWGLGLDEMIKGFFFPTQKQEITVPVAPATQPAKAVDPVKATENRDTYEPDTD